MADWDSMSRFIAQTRGQAFQTIGRAFSFVLNPQTSAEYFEGSAACFEINVFPGLLINGHIKNF